MQEKKYKLIKGGAVYIDGDFKKTDIEIKDGKISRIGEGLENSSDETEVIDATDKVVVPGLIDMHVHFREPGYSYKETIKTGSEAAAAGGFVSVCTMPNLNPAPDSLENLEKQLEIIKKDSHIEVIPFATITKNRMGNELTDYRVLAPLVAGFSDDGTGVQSEEIMLKAMTGIAATDKILAAHCEVEKLLDRGYIHKGDYALKNNHRGISSESEWKEIERDIKLAEVTGCRLHICHVSTKEGVHLIRMAKQRGVQVTAETCPHYLTFTDDDLQEDGRFKMNPPIRGQEDREALRQGVIDGTIDVIVTDHAPHALNEKSKGLEKSAMGVVGLETSFAATYTTMVKSGLMSLERLIELMSVVPAKILDLDTKGKLETDGEASLTIIDTEKSFVVDPDGFKTKGRATPYSGMTLQGVIEQTFYKGQRVYKN